MSPNEALEVASKHYAATLLDDVLGEPGRVYLASRGISLDVAEQAGVGFVPGPADTGWQRMVNLLAAAGVSDDAALNAGLVRRSAKSGRLYDALLGRLFVPVLLDGAVRGFVGRVVPGELDDAAPRYVVRPSSAIHDPRTLLYGLDEVVEGETTTIVEGALDVLAMRSRGFAGRVVAKLGKTLHEQQSARLVRLGIDAVLMPDADATGIGSIEPDVQMLARAGIPTAAIFVARLPENLDPADCTLEQLNAACAAASTAQALKIDVSRPQKSRSQNETPAPDGPPPIERARAYLARMAPAISGDGGHDRCYAAAAALAHGFALPRDEALGLLASEYNPRCTPPWSASELEHKVDSAIKNGHARPRGYLRDAKPSIDFLRPTSSDEAVLDDADEIERDDDTAWPVQVLGYEGDSVFCYQRAQHQILRYSPSDFTDRTLINLLGKRWLELAFPAANGRKAFASLEIYDSICTLAKQRGRFSPQRVRGRGAWEDRGRIVFNVGDRILDSASKAVETSSDYVYQGGDAFRFDASAKPLTDAQGRELYAIASRFSWSDPTSAWLLVGWIALAPLAGVLSWRPHIWITGGAGSGKTTIQTQFVERLLHDAGVMFLFGASTESGIRQTLRGDAVPVLLDEAESKTEFDAGRLEIVIGMIRRASSKTGGRETRGTPRGGAISYTISSMFCLSSITVGIKNTEDRDRISILALEAATDQTSESDWRELESMLGSMPADVSSRLYARVVAHAETLLANVATFRRAASEYFGRARTGDQIGTLLAGAAFLGSIEVVSLEQAKAAVQAFCAESPDEFAVEQADDADRVLDALFSATMQLASGERRSVAWVALSAAQRLPSVSMPLGEQEIARDALLRHGMRVKFIEGIEYLLVANGSRGIAALMRGTPYATDLRGQLLRLRSLGIVSVKASQRFGQAVKRVVAVPISLCDRYLDDSEET